MHISICNHNQILCSHTHIICGFSFLILMNHSPVNRIDFPDSISRNLQKQVAIFPNLYTPGHGFIQSFSDFYLLSFTVSGTIIIFHTSHAVLIFRFYIHANQNTSVSSKRCFINGFPFHTEKTGNLLPFFPGLALVRRLVEHQFVVTVSCKHFQASLFHNLQIHNLHTSFRHRQFILQIPSHCFGFHGICLVLPSVSTAAAHQASRSRNAQTYCCRNRQNLFPFFIFLHIKNLLPVVCNNPTKGISM